MRAAIDDLVASTLSFDESVRVSRIDWHQDQMPPTLYVDDWTVLRVRLWTEPESNARCDM